MKWKQLLLIVAVSATSAVGSVWTYGKLIQLKKQHCTIHRWQTACQLCRFF